MGLFRVPAEDIAYIEAYGNYCDVRLFNGEVVTMTFQLHYFVDALSKLKHNFFARVGKSLIVNKDFVYAINIWLSTVYTFAGNSQSANAYYHLLDFYNAIANDGKMVVFSDKEDAVGVANPQKAKAENVGSMKSVLRSCITARLGRKANSDKVEIAGA